MADTDIEDRLRRLEAAVFGGDPDIRLKPRKPVALSQLSRSPLLTSGQKKITLIVGYNELMQHNPPISLLQIKEQWTAAKFAKKCDPKQLERAIVDGLVRDPEGKHAYDLTQDGEDFVREILQAYDNGKEGRK
jgi:hypothetical protein